MNFSHEYTGKVLEAFAQISQIPRPSKKEQKIVAWLMNWATANGFQAQTDVALNVLIKVPPSTGYETSQTLVLQGHLDMVCEKAKGHEHDFDNDPIELVFTEDGWLTANQTTLGADNGIAIAMAMVVATDKTIEHPALELLFTTDEETGLTATDGDYRAAYADITRQAIDLVFAYPDGVAEMSKDIDGLVDTSNNLATVRI